MKCPHCEGRGWKHNQRYYSAKERYPTCYYLKYEPTVTCRKCKGTGFIIGNPKEVLEFLKHLEVAKFADDTEYQRQVRQCISAIESTP